MNLFGKLVLKHCARSFPIAFSNALTRTLHNINARKIHSTVTGDLSNSLWMSKILLEAVKCQCHVLRSQTIKEVSNSSCNEINHQLLLSSQAQILQLHHDVVLSYHHIYVQEQNNTDTGKADIYLFKCKPLISYTVYVHSKDLERNILSEIKMHVEIHNLHRSPCSLLILQLYDEQEHHVLFYGFS